jgi:hypothetical protein
MENDLDPFTTSDTPLAAFLKYHNHAIVGMKPDPNDIKRKVYVFIKQDNTDILIEEFYHGEPMVNPHLYYRALVKEVFKKLRESR